MPTEDSDEPPAHPLPREGDVWYVSYGSNMSQARLSAYLEGGVPPGGNAANPGAHDPTPPRRSVPVDLPGALYFAGDSHQWHGGVAFYDHDGEGGPTAARAYLVTAHQFADIAAQEMYRIPQPGDPLVEVVVDGLDHVEHNEPSPAYLAMLADGLRESRQWSDEDIAAYFDRVVPSS